MTFIKLKMVDPMTESDDANEVYMRPTHIVHIEPYMGPFGLQAFGPDGKCTHTGKYKQVSGSLMMLYGGAQRIVQETPQEIIGKIDAAEEKKEYES